MLILASASPRRQELLRNAGIAFVVEPADINENIREGEVPHEFAERLSREKASAIAAKHPDDFVLGADTIVVVDTVILGKPKDPADATRMLQLLSGREHEVITAVTLAVPSDGRHELQTSSDSTRVTMSEITKEEIRSYVATDEPLDKAGAYAIQGMASRWIPRIEGDYSNVVGLPVAVVYRMLRPFLTK